MVTKVTADYDQLLALQAKVEELQRYFDNTEPLMAGLVVERDELATRVMELERMVAGSGWLP